MTIDEVIRILREREKLGKYKPPEGDDLPHGMPRRPITGERELEHPADFGFYKWDPEFDVGLPNGVLPSDMFTDEEFEEIKRALEGGMGGIVGRTIAPAPLNDSMADMLRSMLRRGMNPVRPPGVR